MSSVPPAQPATTSSPSPASLNGEPGLPPVPDFTIHPGDKLDVAIESFQSNGAATLELIAVEPLPPGALLEGNRLIWTPTWEQLGSFPVTVSANGSSGTFGQRSFVIQVENAPPQLAPVNDQEVHPGDELSVEMSAHDPDDPLEQLTFSMPKGPADADLDPQTGLFEWTPGPGDVGSTQVTIRVTDPGGASDQESFVVNVVNEPPHLFPLPDHPAEVDELVEFTADAYDPDGDPLTYTLVAGPPDSTLSSKGVFQWQATAVGDYPVTIRVTDGLGGKAERSCVIRVT